MNRVWMIALVIGMLGSVAAADDMFDPPWAGQSNNWVHAEWDTWPNFPGPMAPDSWSHGPTEPGAENPFPAWAPYASACAEMKSTTYNGRQSVLVYDVGAGYEPSNCSLSFFLPNFDNNNPAKDVFVQLTYYRPNGPDLIFDSWKTWSGLNPLGPFGDIGDPTLVVPNVGATYNYGNGWYTRSYSFSIAPNPTWEIIEITFGQDMNLGFFGVDQAVVDTYCYPEPATGMLLILAGFWTTLRRRRPGKNCL